MSDLPASVEPWSLVTVEHATGGTGAAVLHGGELYAPDAWVGLPGAIDIVRSWCSHVEQLRSWVPKKAELVPDATVVTALQYPSKVLCSGPNYTDHLAEMGEASLGEDWTPYFFLKPPTTTMIADGDAVVVRGTADERVDWEGELAVVIGVGGRDLTPEQAPRHVAGYAVANDISLRGPHRRNTPAAPFQWDWLASKAADTSLPFGPGVVPSWLILDPQALRIVTRVNGEVMQDGSTATMVFDVADLLAAASRLVTLEPGDVILTGTPAGVGAARDRFLHIGDVVDVTIPGVGSISNPIRARE